MNTPFSCMNETMAIISEDCCSQNCLCRGVPGYMNKLIMIEFVDDLLE